MDRIYPVLDIKISHQPTWYIIPQFRSVGHTSNIRMDYNFSIWPLKDIRSITITTYMHKKYRVFVCHLKIMNGSKSVDVPDLGRTVVRYWHQLPVLHMNNVVVVQRSWYASSLPSMQTFLLSHQIVILDKHYNCRLPSHEKCHIIFLHFSKHFREILPRTLITAALRHPFSCFSLPCEGSRRALWRAGSDLRGWRSGSPG